MLLIVVDHVLFPPFQHPISRLRIWLVDVTVRYGLLGDRLRRIHRRSVVGVDLGARVDLKVRLFY